MHRPKKYDHKSRATSPTPKPKGPPMESTEVSKSTTKEVSKPKNTTRKKRRQKKKGKTLRILYANVRGIRGKIQSLQNAVDLHQSHICLIVETKGKPPMLKGYKWESEINSQASKGGIAIAVRNDLLQHIKIIPSESDINTMWIEMATNNSTLHIGTFYGKQETASKEENEREFADLTTQIKRLQMKGEVILTGDFNAKLQVQTTNQKESPRGAMLHKLLEETEMSPTTLTNTKGTYTRVNRNDPEEKSIIDYILMTNRIAQTIKNTEIDEQGTMRIKGKKESDHNTITTSVTKMWDNKIEKKKIWNIKNREGWETFNTEMKKEIAKNPNNTNYNHLERSVNTALHRSIGKITISSGNKPNRENKQIRKLRKKKKELRKELNKTKEGNNTKNTERMKNQHSKIIKEIQEEVSAYNKRKTMTQINKINQIRDEGKRKNEIWNIRRKLSNKSGLNYHIITEEGEKITEKTEVKTHIADYYENLYQ